MSSFSTTPDLIEWEEVNAIDATIGTERLVEEMMAERSQTRRE